MIIGLFSLFVILLCAGIGIAAFAFWIWMLVDAVQNQGLSEGEKIAWVLAIVFLHFIGAFLYLLIGHSKNTSSGAPVSGAPPVIS